MTTDEKVKEALAGPLSIEQRDLLTEVSTTLHDRLEAVAVMTQAHADVVGQLTRLTKHAKMLETEIEGFDLLLDTLRHEAQQPNGTLGFMLPWLAFSSVAIAITVGVCWTIWG